MADLQLAPGLNVAGYFRAELGIGEAARQLLGAIERAGIPFTTVLPSLAMASRQEHPFSDERSSPRFDTNLICVNFDAIVAFALDIGAEFFRGRYSIGYWWWESTRLPRVYRPAFDLVDEIWVASSYTAAALAAETEKPVTVVPLPVDPPDVPARMRGDLGLPEGFLFLYNFDFLSVFERKNPLGVVEAFRRAFEPNDGAVLVVKSINGDLRREKLAALRAHAAGRSDILIVDGYLSAQDKNALSALCDCYVSLHRSEGFGLTLAEAMSQAKPVIATGYSGNLEFMDERNSYLVPYELRSISAGRDPYPAEGEWAEPDLGAAAALMRHVFEDPAEAAERGLRGAHTIREVHSPERAGAVIAARLEEIRRSRDFVAPTAGEIFFATARVRIEEAGLRAATGPVALASQHARLGLPARLARRLARRLLWPQILRQHEINRALLDALRALQEDLQQLERSVRGGERPDGATPARPRADDTRR